METMTRLGKAGRADASEVQVVHTTMGEVRLA
jgi:hypothetical protein